MESIGNNKHFWISGFPATGGLKVVLMNLQRLFLFILVLTLGCRTLSAGQSEAGAASPPKQENPASPANTTITVPEIKPDKQIELNTRVLQTSTDESNRIDAANLLLFDPNPLARKALIETLNLTSNSAARMAICNVLIQSRKTKQEIPNKKDFIEPLLNIFSTKVDEEAHLAADAILIFKYQEIGPLLDKLVTDPEKPAKTRINVIEVLKKVWEKEAIIRLYLLVDDTNQEVAAEAAKALDSLGFQVGFSGADRARIIADIQNKEILEVLKDLLIKQEMQLSQQKTDNESLKKFTLAVLDEAYTGIGVDDATKGKFLNKYLTDSRGWVKSWAIDKVMIWRKTPQTLIPAELEPVIISLIADPSKEVRLKALELIGLMQPMRTVDLTSQLITQFEAEQDSQVKIELLENLGIACSAALSSTATAAAKITPATRQRVLGYATDFLSSDDIPKATIGAKVMKQLLEREGLTEQEVKTYLGRISERYNRQQADPNSNLKAELLNAMVGLAAESSAIREFARTAFEPFFSEALNSNTDFIRETAIDGLGYVNKSGALKSLSKQIDKERSEKARLKIIDFAKDVGTKEDLDWLSKRLSSGTTAEAKQAWAAMKKIFGTVDIETLNEWELQLLSPDSKYNLTEAQKIDFLVIVLGKTPAGNKQKYQELIANRYFGSGQYEQAANYFTLLYDAASNTDEKNKILPKLLDSYLRWPNEKLTAKLVNEYLSKNNFNPDDAAIVTIEKYFKDTGVTTDKSVILKALKEITPSQVKTGWQTKLQLWSDLITKAASEKPGASTKEAP
jgi:HEAT repeat protein